MNGSRLNRRRCVLRVSSESMKMSNRLHEREKESWRVQIATLEEQLAKSSTEHECALQQLREASETELSKVKKGMEHQLEQRVAKTTSSQKDTQSAYRLAEEYAAQIATLEEQLAKSSTEHECALQQLREASETELSQVKKAMEHQLEQRVTKTSSSPGRSPTFKCPGRAVKPGNDSKLQRDTQPAYRLAEEYAAKQRATRMFQLCNYS
jgi:ElaB/YqjD/DUF883 family membrane-anchored ribosome-binding protein